MQNIVPSDSMPESRSNAGIFPVFYTEAVPNKFRTEKEGRPVFEEKEFVEIIIAGDSKTKVHEPVNQGHIERWPEQYQKFKDGLEQATEGTPVEQWNYLSKSQVAELKALNIKTVEALAELPDTGLQRLGMGARSLQGKAQSFIAMSKEDATKEELMKANQALQAQIDELQKQIKPRRKTTKKK